MTSFANHIVGSRAFRAAIILVILLAGVLAAKSELKTNS